MKAFALGAGLMGPAIAKNLVDSKEVPEATITDIDENKLKTLSEWFKSDKLSTRARYCGQNAAVKLMRQFDVVTRALPHAFALHANNVAIEADVDMVDLTIERCMMDHDSLLKKNILLIPGSGVAPGLTERAPFIELG